MISLRQKAKRRSLRVASLFSGVGGFELGLSRAGHYVQSFCELDPVARAVLKKRFKGVPIHRDVRTLKSLPKHIDLLTAGFPCQDLSQAGRTRGIVGSQSALVWEVFRLLRSSDAPFVLFENVPFMLRLDGGSAIAALVDRLEELGFAWAYRTVDTRAFGIPHRRPRVFLLGSRKDDPRSVLLADDAEAVSNKASGSYGFYWTEGNRGIGWALGAIPALKAGSGLGLPSAPAMILPRTGISTPHICDAERLQGFPPHWTSPASEISRESDRWRLVGNAVNVRIARWIGERLAAPGCLLEKPMIELSTPPWPKAAFNISGQRYISAATEYPVRRAFRPLHKFLRFEPKPLSLKAAVGVLKRLRTSKLKPAGILLDELARHIHRLENING